MKYSIPALALILAGCSPFSKDDQDTSDPTSEIAPETSELSECGQQVLSDSSSAYSDCFKGDYEDGFIYGGCETCGYYQNVGDSQGAYDCITCEEGYTIDVVFDDCTGYCVPLGTSSTPISLDECSADTECVYDQ
jgi:hypothetical protein